MPDEFTVVLRAPSGSKFLPEKGLQVFLSDPAGLSGTYRVRLLTRWENIGLAEPIPRELWTEVHGPADDIDDAIRIFPSLARPAAVALAFAANASVGTLEPHLVINSTEGRDSREFVEVFLPDKRGLPRQGRFVQVDHLERLITALFQSREARVSRALQQYELALRHWYIGGEFLCLAHLWMAVEALTPLVREQELTARGITVEGLADAVGIRRAGRCATCGLNPKWRHDLDGWVRRHLVLGGDDELSAAARKASDGFEHGYLDLSAVHQTALKHAGDLFRHVRRVILEVLGIDGEAYDFLLAREPIDSASMRKIIRGRFTGTTGDMAAPTQEYPSLRWESTVSGASRTDDEMSFAFAEKYTVVCAGGVGFIGEAFEVRGRADAIERFNTGNIELAINQPPADPHSAARTKALALAESAQRQCGFPERIPIASSNVVGILTFAWFANVFGLFEAAVSLARQHRTVEAVLLAAELHQQSLRLMHFARTPFDRIGLMIGDAEEAVARQDALAARESAITGVPAGSNGATYEELVDRIRADWPGEHRREWPSADEMASAQGRERAHLVRNLAGTITVATATTSLRSAPRPGEPEDQISMTTTADLPGLEAEVLATCAESLVFGRQALDDVLEHSPAASTDVLLESVMSVHALLDEAL